MIRINQYKDPYSTTRISWKVTCFFFVAGHNSPWKVVPFSFLSLGSADSDIPLQCDHGKKVAVVVSDGSCWESFKLQTTQGMAVQGSTMSVFLWSFQASNKQKNEIKKVTGYLAPENGCLEDDRFLFGWPIFRGYGECKWKKYCWHNQIVSSFNRMYALYIFILKFNVVPLSTRGWEGSGGRKSSKAGWRTSHGLVGILSVIHWKSLIVTYEGLGCV